MGNIVNKIAFPVPIAEELKDPLYISNQGFMIPLLYYPYKNSEKLIIFSHGNATDLGACMDYLKSLRDLLKVSVLGYEYIGYGKTRYIGNDMSSWNKQIFPSETNCYHSIDAAYNWAMEHIKPTEIILIGQSIGTGPTCYLAGNNNIDKVVLITPFTSTIAIVTKWSSLLYPINIFMNKTNIKKHSNKVLIIHGYKDEVIDVSHAKELKDDLQDRCKLVLLHANHNNIINKSKCKQALIDFICNNNE